MLVFSVDLPVIACARTPVKEARRCRENSPGQKHWHGASPDSSMTHIAIQEHVDGTRVRWMEKVSDEQYSGLQYSGLPTKELSQ